MQKRERRGLAAAGRADQRNALSRRCGAAQVRYCWPLAVVRERHLFESDRAAHAGWVDRARWVTHGRDGIEHAEKVGEPRRVEEQSVCEADSLFEPGDEEGSDAHETD